MQDHTMQHKKKMPAFRCLVIIIDSNIRDKLTEFLTDASIPIYYQMHGVGTVSSDFLNLCGLGDTTKPPAMHRPEGTHPDAAGGDESGVAASQERNRYCCQHTVIRHSGMDL